MIQCPLACATHGNPTNQPQEHSMTIKRETRTTSVTRTIVEDVSVSFPAAQVFELASFTSFSIEPATLPQAGSHRASLLVKFAGSQFYMDPVVLREWAAKFNALADCMEDAVAEINARAA
jgi:hypothetical protein